MHKCLTFVLGSDWLEFPKMILIHGKPIKFKLKNENQTTKKNEPLVTILFLDI